MKLLPEVPTKELLDAIAYGQPISASHDDIYRAMYAAAPWVKSEPVGYMGADTHYALSKGDTVCQTVTPSRVCADDVAIYTHPDPRVAELEKEVARLREQLATARRDALEEAANVCDKEAADWNEASKDNLRTERGKQLAMDCWAAASNCATAIRGAEK